MKARKEQKPPHFDPDKAVAALGFLIEKTGETLYPLMKMLYLADKMHLSRYGRFIAGEEYVAMKKGPVPSHTYNLVKILRGDRQAIPGMPNMASYFIYGPDHEITILSAPDYDELSDSDIECLEEIARVHEHVGKWAVRDMSHDKSWKKTWTEKPSHSKARMMDVISIAEEADANRDLIAHLKDPHPGAAK